jgi:molybdopterin-biosynthesis enzyme MoeA-like protein
MPTIGTLIIGDEILSGRRSDKHLNKLIGLLDARGLKLSYAHYIGDEPARIIATLERTFATSDIVFSFGGIGATPDDHTRQCAAAALNVPLAEHPEAIASMAAKVDFELTPNRRKMAEFPVGSTVIPNPYNQIAAFSCGDHHFLPGFPEMAWPMVEWVLETRYAAHFHAVAESMQSILIQDAGESSLIDMMNNLLARYPNIALSSLPQFVPGGRVIDFSLRGAPSEVPLAMAEARAEVTRLGFKYHDKEN